MVKNKERMRMYCDWWLYVLELKDDCWYIGTTTDVDRRFLEHQGLSNGGAKWTKRHRPIRIVEKQHLGMMSDSAAVIYETAKALDYIKKYGKDKVRGGKYNRQQEFRNLVILPNEDKETWRMRYIGSIGAFFSSPNADLSSVDAFYTSYIKRMKEKKNVYRLQNATTYKGFFYKIAIGLFRKNKLL